MCNVVISQITILKFASIIFADAHNHAYYQEYYNSTISPIYFLQVVAYPRELDPLKCPWYTAMLLNFHSG